MKSITVSSISITEVPDIKDKHIDTNLGGFSMEIYRMSSAPVTLYRQKLTKSWRSPVSTI